MTFLAVEVPMIEFSATLDSYRLLAWWLNDGLDTGFTKPALSKHLDTRMCCWFWIFL